MAFITQLQRLTLLHLAISTLFLGRDILTPLSFTIISIISLKADLHINIIYRWKVEVKGPVTVSQRIIPTRMASYRPLVSIPYHSDLPVRQKSGKTSRQLLPSLT